MTGLWRQRVCQWRQFAAETSGIVAAAMQSIFCWNPESHKITVGKKIISIDKQLCSQHACHQQVFSLVCIMDYDWTHVCFRLVHNVGAGHLESVRESGGCDPRSR